jgi:hypothetical protein
MEVRLRRIVRGQGGIADSKLLGRNGAKIEGAKKHRVLGPGEFESPHLLAFEVKESALGAKNLLGSVNSNIAYQQDIACVGVVFRIVTENAVFSVVDLDIVLGYRNALVETRITIRRNLHGRVAEVAELGISGCQRSQQTEKELPH